MSQIESLLPVQTTGQGRMHRNCGHCPEADNQGVGTVDDAVDFEVLGLSGSDTALYLRVLGRPGIEVVELARATGDTVDQTLATLSRLRDHGLVVTRDRTQWAPFEPTAALTAALRLHEDRLNRLRAVVPELQQRFAAAQTADPANTPVDLVSGWAGVSRRYVELLHRARTRVLAFAQPPYDGALNQPVRTDLLSRGIDFRVLLDGRELPASVIEHFRSTPGPTRVAAQTPFRAVLVDDEAAFVALDLAPRTEVALVVRPSPLLDGIVRLMWHLWETSSDLDGSGPDGPTGVELSVLISLAAGLKDETIARQLGLTPRTVRRHVQTLAARTGAHSRFQAAVECARRGWV